MAKEAIKEVVINKDKKNAEVCISVELHGQAPGAVGRLEVQRKKVRTMDVVEVLRSNGHNPGRCTSDPGRICNSAGPVTACWRFEDLDAPKAAPKSNRKTTSTKRTKTA